MKKTTQYSASSLLFVICALLLSAGVAFAQSSIFTYQGRLTDGGNPANGGYDMQFKLFDVNSIQQGSTISISSVQVTNGVFKVDLDFGSATFDGSRRFLEIGVRPEDSSDPHTVLLPRQLFTATPYSIRSIEAGSADTANTATIATNAAQLGGVAASQYVLTTDSRLSDARPPTAGSNNYLQNQAAIQQTPANFNISGSGTLGGTLSANAINGNGSGLTSLNASNVASGTLDNARLGIVPAVKGGTGLINPGAIGNYLRSTGTGWLSSAIQPTDVPDGSMFYVQNQTGQQTGANFNISGNGTIGGTLSASTVSGGSLTSTGAVNATTQYNLGGSRILDNNGTLNLFVGVGAGSSVTGGGNVVIGHNAGLIASTGDSNTIVGAFAGQKNTANNNVFVGTSAGLENTSGTENVFVGVNTGDSNTTGGKNTFVGRNAGQANVGGQQNAFFGTSAGSANTSGTNNIFVGNAAGFANTTGVANTIVGSFAGAANVGGQHNTYVGQGAGAEATGSDNTIIGYGGAQFFTTGNNNVFIGSLVANNIVAGSNNTVIGTGAEVSDTVSFGTAIGAGAVVPSSNTIVLGRGQDLVIVPGILSAHPISGSSTPLCISPVAVGSAISFCSSSLRYKTDIQPFAGGLDIVRRLRPITFNWKQATQPRDVGFGAEEVAKIDPLFVTYNDKGQIEGVKYAQISTVLVNAVQQQQTSIAALISENAALNARLAVLEQIVKRSDHSRPYAHKRSSK